MHLSYSEVFDKYYATRTLLMPMHSAMNTDMQYVEASADLHAKRMEMYLAAFPAGYMPKIPGIGWVAVMIGLSNIMNGEPMTAHVDIPDTGRGPDGRVSDAQAEREKGLRAAYQGLLHSIAYNPSINPFYAAAQKMVEMGMAVIAYPMADDTIWPPYPLMRRGKRREPEDGNTREERLVSQWRWKRARSLPWDVYSVDPRDFFFDPYHDPPTWVIERKMVSPAELVAKYPEAMGEHRTLSGETVPSGELIIYVDEDEYGVYYDGVPLLKKHGDGGIAKNEWGVIWYKMALSGWGTTDSRAPWEYRAAGVIRHNRAAIDMKITDINVMEVIRRETAFPGVGIEGQGADGKVKAEQEGESYKRGQAQIWYHSNEVKDHLLAVPEVPQVIFNQLSVTDALLEMGLGPEILTGQPANEPAIAQRTRLSVAQQRFKASRENFQQLVANVLGDLGHIIKHNLGKDHEITAWAMMGGKRVPIKIDPDQIEDEIFLSVDASPPTKADRAFQLTEDERLLGLGAIDMQEFRQRQGIENGDEIDERNIKKAIIDGLIPIASQVAGNLIMGEQPGLEEQARMEQAEEGLPPNTNGARPDAEFFGDGNDVQREVGQQMAPFIEGRV